jgi:hypothetical protein
MANFYQTDSSIDFGQLYVVKGLAARSVDDFFDLGRSPVYRDTYTVGFLAFRGSEMFMTHRNISASRVENMIKKSTILENLDQEHKDKLEEQIQFMELKLAINILSRL